MFNWNRLAWESSRPIWQAGCLMLAWGIVGQFTMVRAEVWLNEIFFDPPGSFGDLVDEMIELRGTPSMSLANHYLIFLENEDTAAGTGSTGTIDAIFDLGDKSIGSNGYALFLQKNHRYNTAAIAPGTSLYVNAGSGQGWGSGETSSIGFSNLFTTPGDVGKIENSGFTAMLIRNDSGLPPILGTDLDAGNDGLDLPTGQAGWAIVDAIGVHSEFNESDFGRLYAMVNFGTGPSNRIPEGAEYYNTEVVTIDQFEIEHLARWGNSTGQVVADWHATNVTDNSATGAALNNIGDLRQSGDPHPANDFDPLTPPGVPQVIESSKQAPYGVPLLRSLGSANYMLGDFSGDGYVDAADFTVWRDHQGVPGTSANLLRGDANNDYVVDAMDHLAWQATFGAPASALTGGLAISTVPEPAAVVVSLAIAAGCLAVRSRRVGR